MADNDDGIRRVEDFPDSSIFLSRIEYPALRIPARETADLRRRLSKQLLRIPKLKNVYDDPSDPGSYRLLVLADAEAEKDPQVVSVIEELNNDHEVISITSHVIEISYDLLTVDEALKKILNDKVQEVPTSFEIAGQIAHVNLREDCLPYKFWIGKVFLDKNKPRIRTVVNKLGTISNQYRTFEMEVIAGFQGPDWSVVDVKEEKCAFQLDFQNVYWNSRLAGEHKRLVQLIIADARQKKKYMGDETLVVADIMAGVGPFAVPLTAHKNPHNIIVHANDLNPCSHKFLQINSTKNKCRQLFAYNDDGRVFIHRMMQQLKDKEIHKISHFIMNLPASAPEFLDAFRGYPLPPANENNNDSAEDNPTLPWIHSHCFAPKTSEKENYQCAIDRCSNALGCQLDRNRDRINIHVVRDVSPSQNMLCVSFLLPRDVAAMPQIQLETITGEAQKSDTERESKRAKTESTTQICFSKSSFSTVL
ncbi:hypothetical protein ACA910_017272 [Epithemia clementina (nom. ined.)]